MKKWTSNRVMTEEPPSIAERRPPEGREPPGAAMPPQWKRGKVLTAAAAAAVIVLAGAMWVLRGAMESSSATGNGGGASRTARAEKRDFVRTLRIHGVVEAVQSFTVAAPRLAGPGSGAMVITKLATAGQPVKKGTLLVEFDRQNQVKNAQDRKAEYLDLVEQIKKRQAELDAALARDQTEMEQAKNAVETAMLEMRKNEVISRIDAEKNQQNLEEARARLAQLRQTFDLKRAAARAWLRVLEIQRDRAKGAMEHAQVNAEKMAIQAPLDGLVVLNVIWKGGQMGEVQEGDEVRPGVPFLQVVNPAQMQARARVNQADVPNLRAGQPVETRLDAYPGMVLPGRLERIAAIGVTSGLSTKVRTFAATFSIRGADPKLMPDLSAAIDVELERVPGAVVVPQDAVWRENGETYVRVRNGTGYEKRAVKTGAQCDHEVVIESGIEAGAEVMRGARALPVPVPGGGEGTKSKT